MSKYHSMALIKNDLSSLNSFSNEYSSSIFLKYYSFLAIFCETLN